MQYQIIVRDKNKNEVLNLTVPEDSYIGIFKLSPMLGWKKKKMVWKNRNLEIEKRPQKRSIS